MFFFNYNSKTSILNSTYSIVYIPRYSSIIILHLRLAPSLYFVASKSTTRHNIQYF